MTDLAARIATEIEELSHAGVTFAIAPGVYRVNFKTGGTAATLYETDDLDDAIAHGRRMAQQPQAKPEPPLGPTGPRRSHKGQMFRHNRKLATRRAKRPKGTA
jgi:hypothetical protein